MILPILPLLQSHEQWRTEENWWVGTGRDTDDESEDKLLGRFPTNEVKDDQRNEYGQRSVDWSGESLADALADDLIKAFFAIARVLEIFADSVKHHDGVVNWETKNHQQGGNKKCVDFVAFKMAED